MIPHNINDFLYESNLIEGIDIPDGLLEEYWDNPAGQVHTLYERHARNSCVALRRAMELYDQPLTADILFSLHRLQMDGFLSPSEIGKCRTIRVRVGGDVCPPPEHIPSLLLSFLKLYNKNPTWSAPRLHYEFESIHPFVDGNGRTGRLLYAMDLLRRKEPIKSILSLFSEDAQYDFYNARANYYAAIQYHKNTLELVKREREGRL